MDRPAENPADAGSASPATPTANRVSVSTLEVPADAGAGDSPPPSSSRALRAVAKRFVGAYYDDLNASPSRLARYYTDASVFTVEDASTPRPRGRTGKQSDAERENQQREPHDDELDFYDSGPESPMSRLLATAPSASGTEGILARRAKLFKNRLARVVSTDVQTIPGGNVLAVVLGTLSRRKSETSKDSKDSRYTRGKEVTFMHSFVLAHRHSQEGDCDVSETNDEESSSFETRVSRDFHLENAKFVIVNEVFRRVDPVDTNSPAATAATVLAAAMSPPPTPPRATTPEEGHERRGVEVDGAGEFSGEAIAARFAANAATPRKHARQTNPGHVASPNPFVDEREDLTPGARVGARDAASRLGSVGVGSVAGASRPTSPDARAIPLPSPGLLSRPGSSGSQANSQTFRSSRRSASRYDPSADEDEDGVGRVSRALAFEKREEDDRSRAPRDVARFGDRSPREERGFERSRLAENAGSLPSRDDKGASVVPNASDASSVGKELPPSARVTREHRERRRMYSSASSSPAMSAAAPGSSLNSPLHDRNSSGFAKDSPAAKRGLGFLPAGTLPADAGPWDPRASPGGMPPGARLVTLSERSDEGSQGAHSMSVSVSSQPSMSGRNSEDGDREAAAERDRTRHQDDEHSLREFPVDELEPVNLDDVRLFRMARDPRAHSGHSSRRSSPAATPSRRRRDPPNAFISDDAYTGTNVNGEIPDLAAQYSYEPGVYATGTGLRGGAYDARGYATRAYHSARASPVVSREGGRRNDYRASYGYAGTNAREMRSSSSRDTRHSMGGSYSAATSAAASPAPSRGGSRGGARGAEYVPAFARPPRRRFDSAPPSPSMGATRAEAFGARRAEGSRDARDAARYYRSGYPRDFRFERDFRGRSRSRPASSSSYRVVGVGVHGETIVTSKPEPEEQLDVAVNYLSMLAAALHFTAAAVAFAVLVVAVSANKTSTKRLVARLDRIDGAFEEGRFSGAAQGRFANGFERKSGSASSYRAAGARADARYGADAAASGRGYSLPAGSGPAAPPTPRAPTDV